MKLLSIQKKYNTILLGTNFLQKYSFTGIMYDYNKTRFQKVWTIKPSI
jgi:hypothetical protein